MAVDEALRAQKVEQATGLSAAEVATRTQTYGPNKFAEAPKEPAWQVFLRQYGDPMQIVLLIAGGISLFLPDQFATGVLLIGLTLLNAFLGMNQEGKAEASVAALQKMMVVQAKVRRGGEIVQVPMEQLVPGDIVNVEAGDLVPADGRILRAATLEIDELALTGESAPVPKSVDPVAADSALGDRVDMAFMNTQVTRGAATFVVDRDGHGDRGRPHLRHAAVADGRGHAADQATEHADQPDPDHRRRRAGDLHRPRPGAEPAVRHPVPVRGRVLRVGHPDRPAGRRHDDPRRGDLDARRRRGDREAPALRGDARFHLGHQLGQDRAPSR